MPGWVRAGGLRELADMFVSQRDARREGGTPPTFPPVAAQQPCSGLGYGRESSVAATTSCPSCGKVHRVPDGAAGERMSCACGQVFVMGQQATTGGVGACLPATPEELLAEPERCWYAVIDGGRKGPLAKDELRLLLLGSGPNRTTLVWKEGMPTWSPAAQVPELAHLFSSRSGPSPASLPLAGSLTTRGAANAMNWLVVGGGALVLVSFFLPWIDIGLFSFGGYRIPGLAWGLSALADTDGGGEASSGWRNLLLLLYLVPLLGIGPVYAQFVGSHHRNAYAVACAIGIAGIIALFFGPPLLGGKLPLGCLGIGFYGTVFGVGMMLSGASVQRPARRW